uniref:IS110 family transposase n=1 Tax=Gordonibacter urolithinfaciens TaxID=1335613 RepID=UPI003A8D5E06
MAEGNRVVTVGVDTHKDAHVAAALDASGALLGTASFPADARGYASMVAWMRAFGRVEAAGVEGTGGYGAGLARALDAS